MAEDTCPVFRPSEEEFSNFRTYMESIHSAHPHIGICKIIPPRSWKGPDIDLQKLNIKVAAPVKQHVSGKHGVCQVELLEQRSMPLNAFHHAALRSEYFNPDYAERERRFWKYILGNSGFGVPMYGADVPGTLFDGTESHPAWNLNHLDNMLQELPMILPGVNTTMLYIGSWRAMFAFHVEDMDLYSINYLHYGAPKSWYGISPTYRRRFEQMAEKFYPTEFSQCHQFLRHKTKIFSPQRLQEERIPYDTALQHPGEFMITFPGSYHAGFNHGFNIAEAINFALSHWLDVGRQAYSCVCMRDAVSLDVNLLETIHIQEIVRCLKQQQTIPTWALRVLPLPKVSTLPASFVVDADENENDDGYFLSEPELFSRKENRSKMGDMVANEEKVGLESLNGRLRCVCHYEVQYCSMTDLAESPSAPGFSFTSPTSTSASCTTVRGQSQSIEQHVRGDPTTDYFFETMAESTSTAEKASPTSSFSADDGTASSSFTPHISNQGSPAERRQKAEFVDRRDDADDVVEDDDNDDDEDEEEDIEEDIEEEEEEDVAEDKDEEDETVVQCSTCALWFHPSCLQYFFELPINASREYDLRLLDIPQCHVCHDITVQRRLHRGRSPLSKQNPSLWMPSSSGGGGMGTRQGKRKRDQSLGIDDDDVVDSPKIKQSVSFDEKTTPSHTDPGTSHDAVLPHTPTATSASSRMPPHGHAAVLLHPTATDDMTGAVPQPSPPIATELFPLDSGGVRGAAVPGPIETIDLVDDDMEPPRDATIFAAAAAAAPTSSNAVPTPAPPMTQPPPPEPTTTTSSNVHLPPRRRRPLMVMPARIIHAIPSTLPSPNED